MLALFWPRIVYSNYIIINLLSLPLSKSGHTSLVLFDPNGQMGVPAYSLYNTVMHAVFALDAMDNAGFILASEGVRALTKGCTSLVLFGPKG